MWWLPIIIPVLIFGYYIDKLEKNVKLLTKALFQLRTYLCFLNPRIDVNEFGLIDSDSDRENPVGILKRFYETIRDLD
jgi:hypothetical protein